MVNEGTLLLKGNSDVPSLGSLLQLDVARASFVEASRYSGFVIVPFCLLLASTP